MTGTPESRNGSVMFEAGGKFYIWNMWDFGKSQVHYTYNEY